VIATGLSARVTRQSGRDNSTEKAAAASPARQLLGQAQSGRSVIQDFVPLAESLEWELGQQYLKERGNKAFISDASPVPFVVNNDGTLSRNAAEVLYAGLESGAQGAERGARDEIFVLELGIGVGLFARFFLDHFRELCRKGGKDYYDRLCYVAGDKSERMLTDVARHGILANHAGHYRLRLVDAMEPGKLLPDDVAFQSGRNRRTPFQAVFLNYLLDCLPASVLEINGDSAQQLFVRTCVARNVSLADFTDLSVEQLQERAKTAGPGARRELLEVYGLFASEYDYRPVDYKTVPYGEFALQYARRGDSKRLLLSYGPMQSLEKLLDLVADDGFILINDYGQTQATREDEFEHQRFSLATFVGLNFPLLKAYFGEGDKYQWVEPTAEGEGIHSRLLGKDLAPAVRERFEACFNKAAQEKLQEPLVKARQCAKVGRFEMAANYYNEALERQPGNWVLLNEISMFLTFSLRDPKAGINMAKLALELNPTLSSDLWCTLGDGLFEFGRYAEARAAYLRALEINESDVRARFNLAFVHGREKNYPAALEVIAKALALDKTGEYRERLLQKQGEILGLLAQRHQQEYLRMINLVSKYAQTDNSPQRHRDTEKKENEK